MGSRKINDTGIELGARPVLAFPAALLLLLAFSEARAADFDHSHKAFSNELKKFVRKDGVRYRSWKTDRSRLDAYLETLKSITPQDYSQFTADQKKALWLNTYNALAIKLVLDNFPINGKNQDYPANSMRQIPDSWRAVKWEVAGKPVDLYTIKHQILRSEIQDYRTHFAVVPCSKGGPKLHSRAFNAKEIDNTLTSLTTEFFAGRPDHIEFVPEQDTIRVTKIFRWFALDFVKKVDGKPVFPPPPDNEIVQEFVMQFASPEIQKHFEGKKAKVEFLLYDWSLNESSETKS
jgi:hypothetical protein